MIWCDLMMTCYACGNDVNKPCNWKCFPQSPSYEDHYQGLTHLFQDSQPAPGEQFGEKNTAKDCQNISNLAPISIWRCPQLTCVNTWAFGKEVGNVVVVIVAADQLEDEVGLDQEDGEQDHNCCEAQKSEQDNETFFPKEDLPGNFVLIATNAIYPQITSPHCIALDNIRRQPLTCQMTTPKNNTCYAGYNPVKEGPEMWKAGHHCPPPSQAPPI